MFFTRMKRHFQKRDDFKISSIESLNTQYVNTKNSLDELRVYGSRIKEEQKVDTTTIERINSSLNYLAEVSNHIDCTGNFLLYDTLEIGRQYLAVLNAIRDYESVLSGDREREQGLVKQATERIVNEQRQYDDLKATFAKKYDVIINSEEALCKVIVSCVENTDSLLQERLRQLQDEARALRDSDPVIDLCESETPSIAESLPESILIAKYKGEKTAMPILNDIGVSESFHGVYSDLRTDGNILVRTSFENMDDDAIDSFVLSFILSFIEVFPPGSVNVHVFGQNTNYLYKRLHNSFQSESAGETTKKTVRIHTDISDLESIRDVECEDVFRKTTSADPDLYSLYQYDQSDPFNLIVLRDGLVDGNGYALDNILNTIEALSKPGDMGHRSGLRFLIIDNSCSFDKNTGVLSANIKHKIDRIRNNCGIKIDYADGCFTLDGSNIEVLRISSDPDGFIQQRAQYFAGVIDSRANHYVSMDEVFANGTDDTPGSILSIPIGKSGANIAEIAFSCRDDNESIAGKCIGYMVIGQSGSGKSSFFHSLVLNGCMKYSPKDLQFWLLDFKNGGASSKYRESGLPHIRIVAENNKIDDALCLFQMVLDEMERRSSIFNSSFVNDIVEYNALAMKQGLEYLPRIIIAIDEVQEIFRDDNSSILQKMISSISSRMRSSGMHFVMVAQNLNDGKSYMLKDAFMPSAAGRICFRVAANIPRDSGFGEDFIRRSQEIAGLKTGEAYVSFGSDTIKRVKMAYTSPSEMKERYFPVIRGKHPDSKRKPNVIGSKKRLTVMSQIQGKTETYYDVIKEQKNPRGKQIAVIGEDAYRMSPLAIEFRQDDNYYSALLLGSDKQISSSLCTSIAFSLVRQGVKTHLFNGDRTRIMTDDGPVPHPFMFFCQNAAKKNTSAENHKMSELSAVIKDVYSEYLRRRSLLQDSDVDDPEYDPVFIIINDLFAIDSFANDILITNDEDETDGIDFGDLSMKINYDIFSDNKGDDGENHFRENIQNIMSSLLREGCKYNVFMILAVKGDPSVWRNYRSLSDVNNIILFNLTEYADALDNSYYIKEMLKNIASESGDETMAVWVNRKKLSKIRPVIYDMANQKERNAIELLLKGE